MVFSFIEQDPEKESSFELACPLTEEVKDCIFLFDSGATTHLTGDKSLLIDPKPVPEIQVSTAIKGHHAVIRERGNVALSDKHLLQDVAYISTASNNLISEGRLCDADYSITKTK